MSACSIFTQYGRLGADAEKNYNAGDFDSAVRKAVASLKEKPDYESSVQLLRKAAPQAYEQHEKSIEKYEQAKNWDSAVQEYDILISLVALVAGIPGNYPTVDTKGKRDAAANNAAETHYMEGMTLLKKDQLEPAAAEFLKSVEFVTGYKDARTQAAEAYYKQGLLFTKSEKFKEAAVVFRRATEVIPGYKDAKMKYDTARAQGMKRIAMMPFEDTTQWGLGESISARVISTAMNSNPEFMEFITREHLSQTMLEQGLQASARIDPTTATKMGKLAGIHSFVVGKVLSVTPLTGREEASTYEATGTRFVRREGDTEGRRVPTSVRYTVHKQKNSAKITASYQIIEVKTGTIKQSQTVNAEKADATKWVTYVGDEDTIPQNAFQGTTGEKHEPDAPETLLDAAVESLSRDLAQSLTAFFQ